MDKEINKIININECEYYNKTGKCKIAHFENNIKFTSCNCEEWDCYFKQLKWKEFELSAMETDNDNERIARHLIEEERDKYLKRLEKAIEFVNDNMQESNYSYSLELLRIMGVNIDG